MPATKTDGSEPAGKDKLEHAVSRLSDLPTIPNTLLRIWQLVDDPDSSASDLERVITMDQALSAKIIRLVNSPYYGVRDPVTSCRQAITLLGFDTVKNLSVCVCVVSACLPDGQVNKEFDLRELWKHSIAVGVTAEAIANRAGIDDPDAAFTAGVLHDVGKLVMNLTLSREYGQALARARKDGVFLREAESVMFGADHQYFGSFLARMWGFPAPLIDVIGKHHTPSPGPGGKATLVEVVSIANTVARMLGVGSSGDAVEVTSAADDLAGIGFTADEADRFVDEIRARVDDAGDMLNLMG